MLTKMIKYPLVAALILQLLGALIATICEQLLWRKYPPSGNFDDIPTMVALFVTLPLGIISGLVVAGVLMLIKRSKEVVHVGIIIPSAVISILYVYFGFIMIQRLLS